MTCKSANCGLSEEPLYKGSLQTFTGEFSKLITAVPSVVYVVMTVIGICFVAYGIIKLRDPEKTGIALVSLLGGGLCSVVSLIFATIGYGLEGMLTVG